MHLFLSPHLDDAALSCGGMLHHLAQQGQRAFVLNIMAGDPPHPLPQSPLIRELHERWATGENPVAARRDEDRAAMRLLGAEAAYLPLLDCVYRSAGGVVLYPDGDDDIFGPVALDDPAREALAALPLPIDAGQVACIYAPLAAGNHVDHQLVRDWGWRLWQEHPQAELRFYEDYPYGENPAAIQKALANCPLPLKPQAFLLTEADFEAKVRAVAAYRSQISTFWQGLDQMRARVHQHMFDADHQQFVERCWLPA